MCIRDRATTVYFLVPTGYFYRYESPTDRYTTTGSTVAMHVGIYIMYVSERLPAAGSVEAVR